MRRIAGWVVLLGCVLGSAGLQAEMKMGLNDCNVRLERDFSVSPDALTSTVGDKVLVMSRQGDLTLDAKPVSLNAEQKRLAADYVQSMQSFVPSLLDFISDVLELVGKVLGQAFADIFGENSEAATGISNALAKAKVKIAERVEQDGGSYHIKAEGIDAIDAAFGSEFEQALEDAVEASLSNVWSLLGAALFSGEGTFESRMEAFGEKMEGLGERIDKSMEGVEDNFEARGEGLCSQAKQLNALETRLRETVPELAHYSAMAVGRSK